MRGERRQLEDLDPEVMSGALSPDRPQFRCSRRQGNGWHWMRLLLDESMHLDAIRHCRIMRDPDAGPVIPGSGIRKIRWAAQGRGKRGGYRVIYFVRRTHGVIWMLTMYPKNVAENIPAHVLRQIRKEVEDG